MIELKNITRVRTLNNYCLIRISRQGGNCSLKLPGTEIEIDTTFNPEKHVEVVGTVQTVPERLEFHKLKLKQKNRVSSMKWKTRVEILPGDTVFVDYLEVLTALGTFFNPMAPNETSRFVITPKKDLYVFVHYSKIYAVMKPDGSLKPVNGHVILDVTEDGKKWNMNEWGKDLFFKVLYTGNKNVDYIIGKNEDADVNVGDYVFIRSPHVIILENSLHPHLKEKMQVIQRRDIIARRDREFKPCAMS